MKSLPGERAWDGDKERAPVGWMLDGQPDQVAPFPDHGGPLRGAAGGTAPFASLGSPGPHLPFVFWKPLLSPLRVCP